MAVRKPKKSKMKKVNIGPGGTRPKRPGLSVGKPRRKPALARGGMNQKGGVNPTGTGGTKKKKKNPKAR